MNRRARWIAVAFLPVLMAVGTVGYSILEGWPLADSFYMTVITISTVGYGEVHQLSAPGQVFGGARSG